MEVTREVEKPVEIVVTRIVEKPVEVVVTRVVEKPVERVVTRVVERPAEKAVTQTAVESATTVEAQPPESSPAASATLVSTRQNVALLASAMAENGQGSAPHAIDDDLESIWNSQLFPIQSIVVTLDGPYLVDSIEMVVAQTPPGQATDEVWLGDASGSRTLYKRLISVQTEDSQTLEVAIEPPRVLNEVMIRTVQSPSHVAWREVRVFGQSPSQVETSAEQPDPVHNGGHMAFGPNDGYLYIGAGDGGPARDPDNRGQDPGSLLGKILRIDVESGVTPYAIPPDNPYAQTEGYRAEIWALGLRNPWGLVFDKQTGALYIPDVGNAKREEVNYQPASSAGGENYGWHIMEGNRCFELPPVFCNVDVDGVTYPAVAFVSPVAVYDHSQGCAIVGGGVYRGATEPGWQDVFLYADFCTGQIWGLRGPVADYQDAWQSTLLIEASFPISSIGEDEEGNVYVVGYQDGSISMITER